MKEKPMRPFHRDVCFHREYDSHRKEGNNSAFHLLWPGRFSITQTFHIPFFSCASSSGGVLFGPPVVRVRPAVQRDGRTGLPGGGQGSVAENADGAKRPAALQEGVLVSTSHCHLKLAPFGNSQHRFLGVRILLYVPLPSYSLMCTSFRAH